MSTTLNKSCYIFIVLFFSINLMQQVGRREDFPFTYFGMYKRGRQNTSNHYKFEINYYYQNKKIVINEKISDIFFIKKKLESILFNNKYLPNNDITQHHTKIIPNKIDEVNKFFKNYVIPHLMKKNLYNKEANLELDVKYWKYLTKDNRNNPDKYLTYHQITLKELEAVKL